MKPYQASFTLASVSLAIASLTSISVLTLAPQITAPAIAQEAGEPVTTTSRPNAIALARHLSKTGAKFYSAYWCPHCHTQKQRFGKQAVSQLDIIECDRKGVRPQTQLCVSKGISAYPTWEIGGKFYVGTQSLENLAKLSKYRNDI